jgi:light-independent protochlorophyllide reductase subunit B
MGWEGANVIFDSWVHPLMMGLEEHLIGMFRHDFEFVDGHRSHLGDGAPAAAPVASSATAPADLAAGPATVQTGPGGAGSAATATLVAEPAVATAQATVPENGMAAADPSPQGEPHWSADGEAELAKIPFFVRGKVRRNTELFARERGIALIDAETLYDAKAHFSR